MITFTIVNRTRPKATIMMMVFHCGRRYRMTIGAGLPAKFWSAKKHRAKVTAEYDGTIINAAIDRFEKAAASYLAECAQNQIIPTEQDFKDAVNSATRARMSASSKTDTQSLSRYLRDVYIPRYEPARSPVTIKKYVTALNKLESYESLYGPVRFDDVDINFYNKFQGWFYRIIGKNNSLYSANYFGSVIKVLKQAYREARDADHLHAGTGTAHRDFRTVSEQGAAIYLTLDELKKIEECDLSVERLRTEYEDQRDRNRESNAASLDTARKLFLIGCYTGLRVSDFSRLDLSNFSDKRIRIRTKKTGSDIVIPVHPVIRRIIEGGFRFDHHLPEQKMNRQIKEVCRLAGIDNIVTIYRTEGMKQVSITKRKYEMVCNHTARRSFATNAAKSGVPLVMIMKILGMTRESTLMKYLRQTAEENADLMAKMDFFK